MTDNAQHHHDDEQTPPSAGPSRLRSLIPARGSVLRVLTITQTSSALVFSVFVSVHLVAPIAAAVGGINAADRTMLLAREYYLPVEPLLVFAPLGIHLISSTLRRLLLVSMTRKLPPLTPHLLTGWLLPFFVLPHLLSHRLIPALSDSPISSLSPSELGFDFVGWGVDRWPEWSVVSYGGLVLVGVWHTGVGLMKVVSRLRNRPTGTIRVDAPDAPRGVIPIRRRIGLRGLLGLILGVVGIGLIRVARESRGGVSSIMIKRYEAVYALMPFASAFS